MPWENPHTTLDTNMTKAIIADDAYNRVAALMKELAEEGSEPASKFTQDYELMHVAHGPFALALSLGARCLRPSWTYAPASRSWKQSWRQKRNLWPSQRSR